MSPQFPVDTVPDGNVFFPHHFVIGVWTALFLVWIVSSGRAKPWGVVGGLLLSLFGWYHLWPTGKPVVGALLTIVGLGLASLALLARPPWRDDGMQRARGAIALALLIAWDDVLSHGFGLWTPLDHAFTYINPFLQYLAPPITHL